MDDEKQNREFGVFTEQNWTTVSHRHALYGRQVEILRLLFCGLHDKDMADQLGISFSTLRTHMDHLFAKFGVEDRNELILAVFKSGMEACRCRVCRRLVQEPKGEASAYDEASPSQ